MISDMMKQVQREGENNGLANNINGNIWRNNNGTYPVIRRDIF
jgi:hypothetical protein